MKVLVQDPVLHAAERRHHAGVTGGHTDKRREGDNRQKYDGQYDDRNDQLRAGIAFFAIFHWNPPLLFVPSSYHKPAAYAMEFRRIARLPA